MRGVISILLGGMLLFGGAAHAAVAGGGEGLSGWLWWVRPEVGDESVWVSVAALELGSSEGPESAETKESFWFGRPADDGKHRFRPVRRASGRVLDQAVGASADGRVLWAAFRSGGSGASGGAVVSWRLVDGGLTGPSVRQVDGPRLPGQGTARALAVVDGRPWVLWRGDRADAAAAVWSAFLETESGLPGLDEAPTDERERFVRDALLLKLPVRPDRAAVRPDDTDASSAEATLDLESGEVQAGSGSGDDADGGGLPRVSDGVEVDRDLPDGRDVLLRMERGRWVPVALPASWPDAGAARLLDLGDGVPALLAGAGNAWTLWRPPAGGVDAEGAVGRSALAPKTWNAEAYTLPGGGDVAFVSAAGQPVAVGVRPRDAVVTALRPGSAVRVGTLNRDPESLVPSGRPEPAAVVGVGDAVALVELPNIRDPLRLAELEGDPSGRFGALTLDGGVLQAGRDLPIQPRPRTGPPPSQTVLMAVLMASTLVMLVFWRKDPAGQSFRLGADTAVASLDRRAIAGLIDLSIGFGVAYLWSGLGPQEILERWPGRGEALTWSLMEPAVIAIAATVLHTAVGEAVFSRSIGKAFLGLRVVDQSGRDASGWRPLVRCLLKTLDLVAYLLLILLVVSPLRQRLGDLVAGTAVVMTKKPAADDGFGG